MRRLLAGPLAALAALAALAGTGCGGGATGPVTDRPASLLLDFAPNAVHAGIYLSLARDYDGGEGVRLRVRRPGEATDPVRLLETGRVDAAIVSITDLALARERGRDLVAIGALVQRPLAAVLARPGVSRPRALAGRRVGISGLPSDRAVLRSVVAGDGGDASAVRTVNVGFNLVPALAGGRVDAVVAFWNVEGLALRGEVDGLREFRVDRFGAPRYPELVVVVTRETLQDRRPLLRALLAALRRGYEEALRDPEASVLAMQQRVRGLDRERTLAELAAVSPAWTSGVERFGQLDRPRLEAWARWAQRFGLVERRPDVGLAFTEP
jgi:putative hydroxymethylpyrimidine transport system substrate-binding protein